MSECKCSIAISVLGDGCRYCQPQEYINRLNFAYGEIDEENDELLEKNESLESQLAEARVTRYREITAIRTRFEVFIRGEWSAQEFRDYMKQLKEQGENE